MKQNFCRVLIFAGSISESWACPESNLPMFSLSWSLLLRRGGVEKRLELALASRKASERTVFGRGDLDLCVVSGRGDLDLCVISGRGDLDLCFAGESQGFVTDPVLGITGFNTGRLLRCRSNGRDCNLEGSHLWQTVCENFALRTQDV